MRQLILSLPVIVVILSVGGFQSAGSKESDDLQQAAMRAAQEQPSIPDVRIVKLTEGAEADLRRLTYEEAANGMQGEYIPERGMDNRNPRHVLPGGWASDCLSNKKGVEAYAPTLCVRDGDRAVMLEPSRVLYKDARNGRYRDVAEGGWRGPPQGEWSYTWEGANKAKKKRRKVRRPKRERPPVPRAGEPSA